MALNHGAENTFPKPIFILSTYPPLKSPQQLTRFYRRVQQHDTTAGSTMQEVATPQQR